VKVEGKENIPKVSCVFICKHQSSWETVVFHGLIPRVCFVLKQELLKIPFFGQGLKAVNSIAIDRSKNLKSFRKVLSNGRTRLKDGLNIVIFPEGTRVPTGHYPRFHRTAMILAKSTGANVLPVAHNSGIFWPNKMGLIKPGCIVIRFGKVISSKNLGIDELNQYCYNWINNEVKNLGA
jgi:1-acyl-sn-glycerol-3-phosphate acyltransferase